MPQKRTLRYNLGHYQNIFKSQNNKTDKPPSGPHNTITNIVSIVVSKFYSILT